MTFLDRLEYRFGRFAIPGLIRYVVAVTAFVYVIIKLNPAFLGWLDLWPEGIRQGQVWRLVTYIFIPRFGSLFLPDWFAAALYLLFLWWVGNGLEQAWGSFRVNLYYLCGMAGITVSAFFFNTYFSNPLLNSTLLFAFAHFYPDEVIYVMYIIPAKVKWLAWLSAVLLAFNFLVAGTGYRMGLIVALSNYFLFFGPGIVRNARNRQQFAERRRKFDLAQTPDDPALHRCAVCNRTELTNPELDFRVSKNGEEYCREHLPKPAPAAPQAG